MTAILTVLHRCDDWQRYQRWREKIAIEIVSIDHGAVRLRGLARRPALLRPEP